MDCRTATFASFATRAQKRWTISFWDVFSVGRFGGILLRRLHLGHLIVDEQSVIDWWLQASKTIDKPFRAGFDSFFFS